MAEQPKTATDLWQDYTFLTQEILKFVQKKEFDMVLELLAQRDKLQSLLDQIADQDFKASPAGQECLKKLQSQNKIITSTLQRCYNNAKHTQHVSNSYDRLGLVTSGSFMDRKS